MDPKDTIGTAINWNYVILFILPLLGLGITAAVNYVNAKTARLVAETAKQQAAENATEVRDLREKQQTTAVIVAEVKGLVSAISPIERQKADLIASLEKNIDFDGNREARDAIQKTVPDPDEEKAGKK